jgi:hypothetical protein
MKPTIQIDRPIKDVVELFMDKKYFKEWKKDFIEFEPITGIPNEIGAVTKLVFKRVTMFETIISKKMPNEIITTYEHKRGEKTIMVHRVTNRFEALAENSTLLVVDTEIMKIDGLLFKLMMALMAGAGRKYSQTQLNQLKILAEKGIKTH